MDAPQIVLLHGFATSSDRTWRDTGWLDILSDEGRQCWPIDILGHGSADKPTDPQAYANLPEWVLGQFPPAPEAASAPEAEPGATPTQPEPVDAIGFSLGAQLLLNLACTHPDRFRRLVLMGVGNNVFEPDPQHGQMIRQAIAGQPDPDNPTAQHFSHLADSPEVDRDALLAFLSQPRAPLSPVDLESVTAKTLVILGDQDFAGPAEPLTRALPNSEQLILPGVDHFATPKQFGCIEAAVRWLTAD